MLVSPKISVLKANSKVMLFESGNSVLIHGRNEIRACSLPQKDKARVQQEVLHYGSNQHDCDTGLPVLQNYKEESLF